MVALFFAQYKRKFAGELILVDDGSTDSTFHITKPLSQHYKWLKFVRYKPNRGKGYAVRQGISAAKHDTIVILDADLSVSVSELLRTYDNMLFNDVPFVINGYRHFFKEQPMHRKIAGIVFRKLITLLFDLPVRDTQTPFKVLHKIPRKLIDIFECDGFAYDIELLAKVYKAGFPLIEQQVSFTDDPDSRVTMRKTLKMIKEILKIKKKTSY